MFSANVAILYESVNVWCISLQKKFLLTQEYDLFLPSCKLCKLTKTVKTKDLETMRASENSSASSIILNSVMSFMMNILLTEGVCGVNVYAICILLL